MQTYDVGDIKGVFNFLDGAIPYICRSPIYRGQANASWKLTANMFRIQVHDERKEAFAKTQKFILWCREHPILSSYGDEHALEIAQHYGMITDLLDFSTNPSIACYFALEPFFGTSPEPEHKVALYILDSLTLSNLENLQVRDFLTSLKEVMSHYTGLYRLDRIAGLSRIVAQEGVFARDSGGSLQNVLCSTNEILGIEYEQQFDGSLTMYKLVFRPSLDDETFFNDLGITKSSIYPPPNDLEREVEKFLDMHAEEEWWEYVKQGPAVTGIHVFSFRGKPRPERPSVEWNDPKYDKWRRFDTSTERFEITGSKRTHRIDILGSELFSSEAIKTTSLCIREILESDAKGAGDIEISLERNRKTQELVVKPRITWAIREMSRLPYNEAQLALTLLNTLRFIILSRVSRPRLNKRGGVSNRLLTKSFSLNGNYEYVYFVSKISEHVVKCYVPLDRLLEMPSLAVACTELLRPIDENTELSFRDNTEDRLDKLYNNLANYDLSFNTFFSPDDAIELWSRLVMPWQICKRDWSGAILNPFEVELFGIN